MAGRERRKQLLLDKNELTQKTHIHIMWSSWIKDLLRDSISCQSFEHWGILHHPLRSTPERLQSCHGHLNARWLRGWPATYGDNFCFCFSKKKTKRFLGLFYSPGITIPHLFRRNGYSSKWRIVILVEWSFPIIIDKPNDMNGYFIPGPNLVYQTWP